MQMAGMKEDRCRLVSQVIGHDVERFMNVWEIVTNRRYEIMKVLTQLASHHKQEFSIHFLYPSRQVCFIFIAIYLQRWFLQLSHQLAPHDHV